MISPLMPPMVATARRCCRAPLIVAALLSIVTPGARAGDPVFAPAVGSPFGLETVINRSSPTFSDLDGDGDLDASVGRGGYGFSFFQNTGNINSPAFAPPLLSPFGFVPVGFSTTSPEYADMDADGDLDLFTGGTAGIHFYENTGDFSSPAFGTPISSPFGLSSGLSLDHPEMADLDGDGDLDFFDGNGAGSFLHARNLGDATTPLFGAVYTNLFGLTSVPSGESCPDFSDVDGDGDLDLFSGSALGDTFFFRNTGSSTFPAFAPAVVNAFGLSPFLNSTPTLVDIDGDLDPDAFVGEHSGFTHFFQNNPPAPQVRITRNQPDFTGLDVLSFSVEFDQHVAPTFSLEDLTATNSLAGNVEVLAVVENPADPFYTAFVKFIDPDLDGVIALQLVGSVHSNGPVVAVPFDSQEYTIIHYPAGDVNKDQVFDIADVALLADANLGLVVLP